MYRLTFSNHALFNLHRLSQQVYLQTGQRWRLTGAVNLLRLIKFASVSRNKAIHSQFITFLKELSQQQLKMLLELGIALPKRLIKQTASGFKAIFSHCGQACRKLFRYLT